jgi:sugar O-acyltransferase (sialic acid O-acetyltransferase NeuD family)
MSNGRQLWILGAGGHGRVVADAARATRRWADILFFDDGLAEQTLVGSWLVQGSSGRFFASESAATDRIVAIGDNRRRHDAIGCCQGGPLAVVLHPSAVVSIDARLGAGTFVAAGAVVCIGADIGSGVIVNTCASVDHDCRLGAAVHVGPGARLGGAVTVGDRSWIGLGATVRHQARIGSDSVVGAGAVVLAGVADNCVVAGNPARPLRSHQHA